MRAVCLCLWSRSIAVAHMRLLKYRYWIDSFIKTSQYLFTRGHEVIMRTNYEQREEQTLILTA